MVLFSAFLFVLPQVSCSQISLATDG